MKRFSFLVLAIGAIVTACSDNSGDSYISGPPVARDLQPASDTAAEMRAIGDAGNVALAAQGSNIRIGAIEWLTSADGGEEGGQVVFFNDRGNKELAHHFVPGDPRRGGRTNITYLVDQSGGNTNDGLTNAQTEPAIDRAMTTWENEDCSTIPITKVADSGADPDLVDELGGPGPPDGTGGFFFADIVHAGWYTTNFPPNVIAVTFTFVFVDINGFFTDIDNNKRLDTAFREIYYNDAFVWRINANIDVETVALHEAGHGLSQAHFGALFQTTSNGQFHFAPRAVMNAGYTGVQQVLAGSDDAGHCTNWGSWPNN